ncbi:MAG: DNA-directed RNA polymerase subunit beta' [Rhodobacteraceae bacterium]|nr:DNA-directed RNA polymerase subunit beta' [Paracoccaceae bacterium]MCY4251241.1 DNA-directed RNA polymerase subunit beta' [Paracoccaceae bacterium]
MKHDFAQNMFKGGKLPESFDEIKISLASPERIIAWSEGEIKKPETINYRTFKPERDGLFCAKIFGPVRDYECLCGKYKRMKFRGITCEKCGVEVTLQKVRRERMGHIQLAAPVAHIWFLKLLPSRIGILLDMKLKDLESVLYFEKFVVTDPGLTEFNEKQLITEAEMHEAKDAFGEESFNASIGAEAIRELLSNLDLGLEQEILREELLTTGSVQRKTDIKKRLKIVSHFLESGNKPEWMILTVLPVIPPELRPLVPLDGGRFATSDLNDLYRRVINRNNRLKRLIELRAPELIIRNEKRMLQESVDALFDNGRRGRVITNTSNKRPLKSLSDMLKGKQGRFRQNLLGKRVDFSGRSVIVTGPELKLHQCGLPKKMAKELFKPFIFSKLQEKELSTTVKQSKKLVERETDEIWDILDEVIREHPVLLNRAPTLHRLGIQAFEPILIEGKAIQLHPLVCSAFNADFDGDQMAVHVPLSLEAQLEARVLMMSTNNVLSPANGAPIIVPSQDMVLGLYYTSLVRKGMPGEGMIFGSVEEVEQALAAGVVHKHAEVRARIRELDEDGEEVSRIYTTTPGRILLGSHLPMNSHVPFEVLNKELRKQEVQEVIDTVYRYCGQKESVIFCDHIMEIGFKEACNAGISFCRSDMLVPNDKNKIVDETRALVATFEEHHKQGMISEGERYQKTVDAWASCTDRIQVKMEKDIQARKFINNVEQERNSIYMMTHSGARGSRDQMKQLAGMRGLISKGTGEIIETPIISNFKEGLNVAEYFNSAHGSRKGLADTALKTANAGYLTRRLVDVAQDCLVREVDCLENPDNPAAEDGVFGIKVEATIRDGEIIVNLAERIVGRVLAEDLTIAGEIFASKGELLSEIRAREIENAGFQSVLIRSPLTCLTQDGVCAKCYGRDLARGSMVNVGEAVGIMAAQSIGEPGTQLTMRTFHIGGIAQQSDERSFIEASTDGKIKFENPKTLTDKSGRTIANGRAMRISVENPNEIAKRPYRVPYGSNILVKKGQKVKRGTRLFEWDAFATSLYSEVEGIVRHIDLIHGMTTSRRTIEEFGITEEVVTDTGGGKKPDRLKPNPQRAPQATEQGRVWFESAELEQGSDNKLIVSSMDMWMVISDEQGQEVSAHYVPQDSVLQVTNGQAINAGDDLFIPPPMKQSQRRISQSFTSHWRDLDTLKPGILIVDEVTGGPLYLENGNPAFYEMSMESIIRVNDGQKVAIGDELVRFPKRTAQTKDITGGLPRVADLFEARNPKDLAVMAEVSGTIRFEREYKNSRVICIDPDDDNIAIAPKYKVPKGLHLEVQEGDKIMRGDLIVDGTPSPQDVLQSRGLGDLARYMIEGVQEVYQLQGVKINDKHIEVILRQMLKKVRVTDPGDTVLMSDEIIDRSEFRKVNEAAQARDEKIAHSIPVILGITKAALGTNSFISAASFQETTKVLTDAAVRGRVDKLSGLKENVIVGRLIPAGTGNAASEIRQIAFKEDERILQLEKESDIFSDFPALIEEDSESLEN